MIRTLAEIRKEYKLAALEESVAPQNPMILFSHWLEDAFSAGAEEPTAMVLATAEPEGIVSARVVLLKAADDKEFRFFTNYDSRKGRQIGTNPHVALTFFWSVLERQVRVEGKVRKTSRKESVDYFLTRPEESRIGACISPQSQVIRDRKYLDDLHQGFQVAPGGPECPSNWGGYIVKPFRIEFWQGRPHRLHDRLQYRWSGRRWMLERLAP
ncbi:MAG TPA: pyridoxamine 5'-phosphate oxidase [Bacteroidales bacterium]|nr:pyridoxamine 5'-phosphate oxidase [Bacteroidales bacterium]HPS63122.1 pyridoxamine 5'-phosphate oxidase [Bacteroidales bacterium]